MNRNNFLPHIALAVILILVAAFAGQLRRWQTYEWKSHVRIFPGASKRAFLKDEQVGRSDTNVSSPPEILVRFKPGVSEETIRAITARFHDQVEDEIEAVPGLDAIDDLDDADVDQLVAQYSALPEVEYAEKNFEISLEDPGEVLSSLPGSTSDPATDHQHPQDPRFEEQWALDNHGQAGGKEGADISAVRAWSVTTGGDDIVVAVIDTGVDYTHSDLANNIWIRPVTVPPYEDRALGTIQDLHGYNAIDNNADPMDENGHGTHCAGIIGAEGGNNVGITGVNWKVRIMPLKFMNAGGFGNTKDAIECINYIIDRRNKGVNVRVISASWGSTVKSRALEDVIRKAYDAGILFVAASGNASVNTDRSPHYPSSYNLKNVISVAALDRNDQLASFSNYGPNSVHIAAPGKDILSTWLNDDYESHSGTSMATPVVAGVAALVLAKQPKLSIEELRQKLLTSVDKLDSLKGKVVTGGRINAAKAVGG
ncbi:MAG TPA: S8 family peptidase [Pyrinomonadaceae bacterium]